METEEIPTDAALFAPVGLESGLCVPLSFRAALYVPDASCVGLFICLLCGLLFEQEVAFQSNPY